MVVGTVGYIIIIRLNLHSIEMLKCSLFSMFSFFFFQKGGRKGRGAGFCVGGRGKMRQIEGVCVIFFYNDNKCEIVNDDFT